MCSVLCVNLLCALLHPDREGLVHSDSCVYALLSTNSATRVPRSQSTVPSVRHGVKSREQLYNFHYKSISF